MCYAFVSGATYFPVREWNSEPPDEKPERSNLTAEMFLQQVVSLSTESKSVLHVNVDDIA
jgi:hypothetical protein